MPSPAAAARKPAPAPNCHPPKQSPPPPAPPRSERQSPSHLTPVRLYSHTRASERPHTHTLTHSHPSHTPPSLRRIAATDPGFASATYSSCSCTGGALRAAAQVEHLDEHRERHREVDVALGDVLVRGLRRPASTPMSSRKRQRQHLHRRVAVDERADRRRRRRSSRPPR